MRKRKTDGCEIGAYNGLIYRICYGLTEDGKMDYSKEFYEFSKYCRCDSCVYRSQRKREPSNNLTVTTDDKGNFAEIAKIIAEYTCSSEKMEERIFIRFVGINRTYRKGFGEVKNYDKTIQERI